MVGWPREWVGGWAGWWAGHAKRPARPPSDPAQPPPTPVPSAPPQPTPPLPVGPCGSRRGCRRRWPGPGPWTQPGARAPGSCPPPWTRCTLARGAGMDVWGVVVGFWSWLKPASPARARGCPPSRPAPHGNHALRRRAGRRVGEFHLLGHGLHGARHLGHPLQGGVGRLLQALGRQVGRRRALKRARRRGHVLGDGLRVGGWVVGWDGWCGMDGGLGCERWGGGEVGRPAARRPPPATRPPPTNPTHPPAHHLPPARPGGCSPPCPRPRPRRP